MAPEKWRHIQWDVVASERVRDLKEGWASEGEQVGDGDTFPQGEGHVMKAVHLGRLSFLRD